MKKLYVLLLPLLFAFCWGGSATAAAATVEDDARLFTDQQIAELNKTGNTLNEKIKGEVFVYTTNEGVDDMEEFADDYLRDKVGNNNNGSVLVIDMGNRNYYISTSGNMIDYITDGRLDDLKSDVEDELRNGDNYAAASQYLKSATDYVNAGVPGGHYRIDRETGKITYYKTITTFEAFIAVAVSAVAAIAFFVVIKGRYQLRLGTYKYPYQQNSDVKLTVNDNRLVNSFVTTRRIVRNNNSGGGGFGGGSTTHSSGGGSFGGGGGSF